MPALRLRSSASHAWTERRCAPSPPVTHRRQCRTLYRGCEITLSVRKSYEYSEEIKAHEKALSEAKQVERLTGRAKVVRATSFPVITPIRAEAA